ncbi:MAG: ATP-binding protein, partial [Thermomicrobiales bacterium]
MSSRIHLVATGSVQPSPEPETLVPFDPRARPDPLRLAPPTPLIGREAELTRLSALIRSRTARLLTLTGSGGVGKTRLAQAIAAAVTGDFADGIAYVSLASIDDPNLVPATVARALGVRETGERSLLDQLEIALRGRDLLLVLDTFERVLPAAELVAGLVAACPRLTVIVTSRARLNLAAEHAVSILPLSLPDVPPARGGKTAHVAFFTEMETAAAVQLFVARARAFVPEFALTPENAGDVTEICRRLDGLPLAIELAAAWSRIMTPAALRDRLEPRLALLTGGPRDLPARQRTMREAIQWSYDLLTATEQALFRRLSVFAGGFTLEAAARVAVVEAGDASVLDLVAALADQSLLGRAASVSSGSGEGALRFAMLDTIREFGLEQLAATGEAPEVHTRHATWYVALTEASEPELQGPDQRIHLDRLECDLDNVRAALAWTLAQGDTSSALRIAGALAFFWIKQGHIAEGRAWLERALDQDASADPGTTRASGSVRAKALIAAGSLAFVQGDYEVGMTRHRAALSAS